MFMKKIIATVSAFLAISFAASFSVVAQESRYMESYVEVNGSAEQEVAPDTFYLRVDIAEQDSKGRKSLEQQQNDMLKALKSLGVDPDRQVVRLSLSSTYFNRRSNMASAAYQIKLVSPAQLAKVWSKLDELGLSGVKFQKAECSDIDKVKDEVRRLAVLNAREQASSMADALGQTVGKCFYIYGGYSDASNVYARPLFAKAMMADGLGQVEENSAGESLEFDKIKVSAKVTARFVLE